MRPESQADLCSNVAIRTTVTSWMAICRLCSQILTKELVIIKLCCFPFILNISAENIQGTLTTLLEIYTTNLNSKYVLIET